jgi:UDP-3-O-[3-hydroxymyristoyl] N-acetylglucosamine deacetylase
MTGHQNTINGPITFDGVGVHSGKPVSMTLYPADPGTGIIFNRTDLGEPVDIPADVTGVFATDLCTVIGDAAGHHVKTIEHLMAALLAMRVDNVLIEVNDAEIPVMDGSSETFVDAISQIGLLPQAQRRRCLRVLKEVRVEIGPCWATLSPHDGVRYEVEIDFEEEAIGRQSYVLDLMPETFARDISRARTFGFMKDVERYWAAGFALGSSLENSVVIGEDNEIVNPEGLRYENEFVRHKLLDAVGDLALAGAPIIGCFQSYRGGHKVNAMALAALLADPAAYEWTDAPVAERARPAASGAAGLAAAAYSADKS